MSGLPSGLRRGSCTGTFVRVILQGFARVGLHGCNRKASHRGVLTGMGVCGAARRRSGSGARWDRAGGGCGWGTLQALAAVRLLRGLKYMYKKEGKQRRCRYLTRNAAERGR